MTGLVSPAGRPITTKAVTTVHMVILHRPANGGAEQKIQILSAEVDGSMATARMVLDGAKQKALQILISLKAVSPTGKA